MVPVLTPVAAHAEWEVYAETPEGVEFPTSVAIIFDSSGNSLRIYRDDDQTVRGIFTIRDGFDTFADSGCPTYQVDAKAPANVRFDDNGCQLEAKRAHFTLGEVADGIVSSRALVRLLNGREVAFRYRLHGVGYRETRFTLEGLRFAVDQALGPDGVVITQ